MGCLHVHIYFSILQQLITSEKEILFSRPFVCLFVSRITEILLVASSRKKIQKMVLGPT